MNSTELHPTTIALGKVRWGSFDLIMSGVNTRGSWTRSSMTMTVSLVRRTAGTVGRTGASTRGMRLKYFDTHTLAESGLKSPAIVMVALFGA